MAIAYVQSRLTYFSGNSGSLAFLSNVAANSLIVVILTHYLETGDSTLSDSQSNTYTQAAARVVSGDMSIEYWYTIASSAGALTVTANPPGGTSSCSMAIHEFSGVTTSTPIDVQDSNTGTSNAVSGGPVTTTVADTVLVAGMVSGAWGGAPGEVITPDGDYTQMQEYEDGDLYIPINTQYRIVSSTLTDTANWSLGASWVWAGWVVAFKAGAPPSGGKCRLSLLHAGH